MEKKRELMKKTLHYTGLFLLCFVIQWFWFTQIMTKSQKTPPEMLLTSVVFIVIVVLLDLVPKKRINK
ncbi:hypothetical protein ACFP7A_11100 [Sporolactobacillus kofuensis]|uniref:Group-specific protein n=1 Tax=Sporolactobacillus kofuensis TaxID=269672 RepID=A0ABW1WIA3_9BACL|nr:hypothetical protein [Sporolactobacillus kofuensis]MCO7176492.1 hypothetical protein [Sporolactobacillus kofuensis]